MAHENELVNVQGLKSSLLEFKNTYISSSVLADWNQSDNTAKDYIKNKPTIASLSDSVVCIASNSTPTSSTTTYTDAFGTTKTFKVGDQIKVYNSADQKYDIYVLYNLSNGVATWAQSGTNYDDSFDTYTVVISSNQGLIDPDILGATVTVGSAVLESGDTVKVPKTSMLPTPTGSAITGYKNTITVNGHTINSYYETEVLTVTITKDQGDGNVTECSVTISANGSTLGTISTGLSLKIAYGVNYTITPSAAPIGYDAPYSITKNWDNTTTKSVTITYLEKVGVDLGLPSSILWAAQNVGATNPEDVGDYFSWGNVIGHAAGSGYSFEQSSYYSTPGATLSDDIPRSVEFDAAMANMGPLWIMPDNTIITELIENTDNELVTNYNNSGVDGYLFKNKTDITKFIFMPLSGYCYQTSLNGVNTNSHYWSTTKYATSNQGDANLLYMDTTTTPEIEHRNKFYGFTVRGIRYQNTCKIHLTSTDNNTTSGIKIKISNNNIVYNVVTDSNGDATFSLPNGTFSIESPTHSLSVRTMVVNGTTTINANCTYIIGNWIFERKGRLYTASKWIEAKQLGTVTDDDAVGIVVNTEDCHLMIAPDDFGSMSLANSNNDPNMTGIPSQLDALLDFDGETHTSQLLNSYGMNTTFALAACRSYLFKNGSKGYVPSLGELYTVCKNKEKITAIITASNMDAFNIGNPYFSSTFLTKYNSYIRFWVCNFNTLLISTTDSPSYLNYVRAFAQWKPISTKLHFTASDNSSIFGIDIEIIDSNGNSYFAKTGVDGDVYLSLDDGTYTVTSPNRLLSNNTFTVFGTNTVINISASYQDFADLDLPSGIKWAVGNLALDDEGNFSIGNINKRGAYFSWGNITPHYLLSNNMFENNYTWGSSSTSAPYSSSPGYSVSANIASNDSVHDATLTLVGSPWHLPTKENFLELYDNTDYIWTIMFGVPGIKFMKKTDHNVYVFLPAFGFGSGQSANVNTDYLYVYYWSSSYKSNTNAYGFRAYFRNSSSTYVNAQDDACQRYFGCQIRPVR